jgi:hypothetical protein
VCVHSYCSVCSTNEVDDNASVCRCICRCCRSINLNQEIVHIYLHVTLVTSVAMGEHCYLTVATETVLHSNGCRDVGARSY